jgi:hypothetical protein
VTTSDADARALSPFTAVSGAFGLTTVVTFDAAKNFSEFNFVVVKKRGG